MFQELVDVVNSKGYSMDVHFMPDDNHGNRVHLRVLDADYRIYECYTNSIRMYGLAEIVLDNIRAYENKLAPDLEKDGELLSAETLAKLKPMYETGPGQQYWNIVSPSVDKTPSIFVETHDGSVIYAGYHLPVPTTGEDICPGCGACNYNCPCVNFKGVQKELDRGTWVKLDRMDEYNPEWLLEPEHALCIPAKVGVMKPAVDEVSETRMSYYWVYNSDISPVFIAVKVDEYRGVVSAGYVNRDHEVCPGCAGYGKPCTQFVGTQEQLDESTWIKVNMDNSIVLLPTEYALVQKLPSEVTNDN